MERVNVYREQFELLAGPFREWPDLPCLICKLGALEPTITEFESKQSIDSRVGAEIWNGCKSGLFHGELACSRTMCRNKYAVAGEWTTVELDDQTDEDPWTRPRNLAELVEEQLAVGAGGEDLAAGDPNLIGLIVKHILPPLPLIALPDTTPAVLTALVESASSVLLSDPGAASTRIRIAIEALLDDQRIRKTEPNRRSRRMVAHQRIELFQAKNKTAADHLMAMKWIGNVGSHEAEPLPLGFVLDGIEHFARAIEVVYDRQQIELERRAARINRSGKSLRPTGLPAVRRAK
jgi:hypothetical protein